MKWLIGIAIVMLLAHAYFKYGTKRLGAQQKREPRWDDEGDDHGGV